jgi:hypothetical protein
MVGGLEVEMGGLADDERMYGEVELELLQFFVVQLGLED